MTAAATVVAALAFAAPAHATSVTEMEQAIAAKAAATPGLGTATSDYRIAVSSGVRGVYRTYQHGVVASSSYGTYVIDHGLEDAWQPTRGWPSHSVWRTNQVAGHWGYAQYFSRGDASVERGVAYKRSDRATAYFIQDSSYTRYSHLGGIRKTGWPTSNASWVARCHVSVQSYERAGTVVAIPRWCPAKAYADPYLRQASNGHGNVQHRGYNGTAVYMMQRKLGMRPNKVTSSTWGSQTQATLNAWMRHHGHPTTTTLNQTTWHRLGIGYPFNSSTWVAPLKGTIGLSRWNHVKRGLTWAKSQVGTDYLWGGTGNAGRSLGYDCSGFLLQAVRASGVNLTRVNNYFDQRPDSDLSNQMLHDSEMQWVSSLSSLRVGDLIFYGTGKTAHHVAMYIGNGMTVQSVYSRVQYLPLYRNGHLDTVGWPSALGIRRPVTDTQVGGRISAFTPAAATPGFVTNPGTHPMASVALPAGTTLWGLNSWAVSLTKTSGALSGSTWTDVHAGGRVSVQGTGNTLIFAGAGAAVRVVPDAHGTLTVPDGATSALLVPDSQAQGVGAGSPVVDHGSNG